ncbi:N-acetylglucosamine 6-phosphate deacetylase [Crinalium epipsammum PCC 9333]|uniref:N-acetylglucosamine 6-phosphate deacetylase n=1 Tax=Crinalium epipsammum PCC 9333 TaxID=1173022 RepID=K9W4V0_9CYAN|nr:N-acetylglucosamine-6-phosphate deacetylase [Crinalium epipsammum]AFZ15383.1 N-acetylglucosamine 6-phosphate deacetylase [Crinalium epipsammum PCC 9333]
MVNVANSKSSLPVDLINARIPGYQGLQQIWMREGRIEKILSMDTVLQRIPPPDLEVLDVEGDWISLGGVDLQINGGLGLAFTDLTSADGDKLEKICQLLWLQGVDGFVPTLVTTSVENIVRSLSVISDFVSSPQGQKSTAAQILGVHLEGPFLNLEKRGAHPSEYLLPLTIDNVKQVLSNYADIVKIITLAPELDTTGEVIPYLRSLGITVSLGHSQATASQAQQAFSQGATMVTHAFNAMPPLHHREPGLLGAALMKQNVQCGIIADGQHVSPLMLELILRASGYEQGIFLVSDALAPLGLPDGVYPWDTRQIEVKNGTARLSDGTLSGTTLALLSGVHNLVKWGICGVESAIALATETPRRAINLSSLSASQFIAEDHQNQYSLLRWHLDSTTAELTWKRLFPEI